MFRCCSSFRFLKTFPSQGSRRAVTVKVPRSANCEIVCERIAEELDVVEARVVLRDKRGGEVVR